MSRRTEDQMLRRFVGMLAASLAMGAVLILLDRLMFTTAPAHGLVRFLALGALIASGMLTYAVAAQLFGAYDLRQIGQMTNFG